MSSSPPGAARRPPHAVGRPGLLIVISGPSGVGKDTLIKRLLELDRNLRYSVSYTTRAPRPREVDGVNYHFVSRDEFERLIREGAFLEHATYDGNLYGTPIAQLDKVREAGHDVVLKIDVQGAEQVRKRAPEALRIFLAQSAPDQAARHLIAEREMELASHFDHVVVNEDLDRAVGEVLAIIQKARSRQT